MSHRCHVISGGKYPCHCLCYFVLVVRREGTYGGWKGLVGDVEHSSTWWKDLRKICRDLHESRWFDECVENESGKIEPDIYSIG